MTTSVTVENVGGFDTHSDNTQQNIRWQQLFTFLDQFLAALAAQPGLRSARAEPRVRRGGFADGETGRVACSRPAPGARVRDRAYARDP